MTIALYIHNIYNHYFSFAIISDEDDFSLPTSPAPDAAAEAMNPLLDWVDERWKALKEFASKRHLRIPLLRLLLILRILEASTYFSISSQPYGIHVQRGTVS